MFHCPKNILIFLLSLQLHDDNAISLLMCFSFQATNPFRSPTFNENKFINIVYLIFFSFRTGQYSACLCLLFISSYSISDFRFLLLVSSHSHVLNFSDPNDDDLHLYFFWPFFLFLFNICWGEMRVESESFV